MAEAPGQRPIVLSSMGLDQKYGRPQFRELHLGAAALFHVVRPPWIATIELVGGRTQHRSNRVERGSPVAGAIRDLAQGEAGRLGTRKSTAARS